MLNNTFSFWSTDAALTFIKLAVPVKSPVTFPVNSPVTSPTKLVLIELGKPIVTLCPLTTLSISLVVPKMLKDCVFKFTAPAVVPSVMSKSLPASKAST